MNRPHLTLALMLAIFQTTGALADNFRGIEYTVQPVFGYEATKRDVPYFHTHLSLMYGARVTGGYRYLSGEVEGTRTTAREDFILPTLTTEDQTDRVKLGIRSLVSFTQSARVSGILRLGGDASRTEHSETQKGVTTKTRGPIYLRPYVGTGLNIMIYRGFGLNIEGTAVIDPHSFRKTTYQGTIAVQVPLWASRR